MTKDVGKKVLSIKYTLYGRPQILSIHVHVAYQDSNHAIAKFYFLFGLTCEFMYIVHARIYLSQSEPDPDLVCQNTFDRKTLTDREKMRETAYQLAEIRLSQ